MRFKKLPEEPPTDRELSFQPHQFYRGRGWNLPSYAQRLGETQSADDNSLYPRTEWKLRKRRKAYQEILSQ